MTPRMPLWVVGPGVCWLVGTPRQIMIHRLGTARLASRCVSEHPGRMDATSHALARLAAISLDDSQGIARGLFDLSWAAAHDGSSPQRDFAGFREALWEQLAAAFEWVPLATSGMDLPTGEREDWGALDRLTQ